MRRIMQKRILFYLPLKLIANGYYKVPRNRRIYCNRTTAHNVKDKPNFAKNVAKLDFLYTISDGLLSTLRNVGQRTELGWPG